METAKEITKKGPSDYIRHACYKGGISISEREKQVKYKIKMPKNIY